MTRIKKMHLLLLISIFLLCCKEICKNGIYFQVAHIHPNSLLKINIDNGNYKKEFMFKKGFQMSLKKRYSLLQNYCSKDSIIRLEILSNNQKDTLVRINKNIVKGCLISIDEEGEIFIIYDYYKGGMREYGFID